MLAQSEERREVFERRSVPTDKGRVGATALGGGTPMSLLEGAVQETEHGPLERHHRIVIDELGCAQSSEGLTVLGRIGEGARLTALRELGDRRNVEVGAVVEQPAHGAVRADVVAAVSEGVQRVQTDERSTDRARPIGQADKSCKIAHAPILGPPQRVEVGPDAK